VHLVAVSLDEDRCLAAIANVILASETIDCTIWQRLYRLAATRCKLET
jgi:hypothetical protein